MRSSSTAASYLFANFFGTFLKIARRELREVFSARHSHNEQVQDIAGNSNCDGCFLLLCIYESARLLAKRTTRHTHAPEHGGLSKHYRGYSSR